MQRQTFDELRGAKQLEQDLKAPDMRGLPVDVGSHKLALHLTSAGTVDAIIAAHVLWHLDVEREVEPDAFTIYVIETILIGAENTAAMLQEKFPGYVNAVNAAKHFKEGQDALSYIAFPPAMGTLTFTGVDERTANRILELASVGLDADLTSRWLES